MRGNRNKALVIVLIVISIIAIIGGAFAYIYFCTDILKSGQQLFAKYLMQNVEQVKQTVSIEKLDELDEKLEQNKYEESVMISYSENSSNEPIIQLTMDTQKDPIEKKIYTILGLSLEGMEDKLELEYMKENNAYSLRFTNAVMQFLTIENSNLKEFARKLGVDEETIELIPDTLDFEKFSFDELKFTDEEIETEINKYIKLLYTNIAKEKYQKNKNTVITVNGKTIETNSYALTLNLQDLKTLFIKVFETLNQDEVILNKLQMLDEKLEELDKSGEITDGKRIKDIFVQELQKMIKDLNETEVKDESNIIITVYEENKKPVRIKFEKDLDYVTLDTIETDGKIQIDINYTSIDEQNTQLSNKISFIKENANKLNISLNSIEGEEQNSTSYSIELTEKDNTTKVDMLIENEENEIIISRKINIVNEIKYREVLDNSNNILLNSLSLEQIISVFNVLGEKINTEYGEPLEPVLNTLAIPTMIIGSALEIYKEGTEAIENTNLSETEIAAFNGKFTAYEGNNVTVSQVNSLLNTVLVHNQQEKMSGREKFVEVTGDIELKADDIAITEVEGNKYYRVTCKLENACVKEIVITQRDQISIDPQEQITIENMSFIQPNSPSMYAPSDVMENAPSTTITSTASRIIGMLRTIATIAIVMYIF